MEIHLLEYTEQHKMLSLGMLQNGVKNLEEIRKEPATMALILINVLVFIAVEFTGTSQDAWHVLEYGAAYTPYIIQNGEVYRLFTSMFLHFGIEHLVNNMLVLFVLGDNLERALGHVKYLIFYLLCGVGANLVSMTVNLMTGSLSVGAGASGAIFGVVGGLVYAVGVNRGRLEDLTSRQLGVMILLTLYHGFTSMNIDNAAHIGGLAAGILLGILLYRKPRRYMGYGI